MQLKGLMIELELQAVTVLSNPSPWKTEKDVVPLAH